MKKAVKEYSQGLPQKRLLTMEKKLSFTGSTKELTQICYATVATKGKGDRLLASISDG